jgi:TonB dependent receptor/Carboxypeptidase regulatory-like domain
MDHNEGLVGHRFRLIVLFGACVLLTAAAQPRAQQSGVGVIEGFVTTQGGTIRLGGAQVVVHNSSNQEVSTVLSDGDGHFRFTALHEGKYTLTAALEGFAMAKATAAVASDTTTERSLDLPLATLTQTVEVMAPASIVSAADTLGGSDSIKSHETDELASGSGLGGALRLLASVIEVPGGLSIKGGRPTQAGVQIGASTLTDPVLGLVHFTLPDDAIDSVAVMPNPYAVEYGRFSSGLVVIQTRRGTDAWHIRLNNLSPTFRSKRHQDLYNINGIAGFGPNFELGGPIVHDRVFLEQTAQYRYSSDDVPSRPEDERRTTHWISSFTRVDANLTTKHSLVATGGFFPSITTLASLGTFTPPDATVDVHERVILGTVTERALWSDALVSESTVQVRGYRASVQPQGTAPMQLSPETTLGNFFNTQYRTPTTFQLIQTASGSAKLPSGLHLFKVGLDVLANDYDGTSDSRPLLIIRSNGVLARRLDFSGPSAQKQRTTDVALYAQDRVQPNSRWFVEFGARLDRDGVIGRWNVTPRIGAALLLNAAGSSVLRGGYGLFFERTPSAAGAFGQFETFTDTRFADDGLTLLGPAVPFVHVTAPNLRTARATTWDVTYEYRWKPSFSVHASVLDRQGRHELMLDTEQSGATGALRLESDGTSQYRDLEVGFHLSHASWADLTASYSFALAEGDLNAFANFFDTMMWPVVAPNAYGPLATDVPHRFLARGRLLPTATWLINGVADWRTGLPYSLVNAYLDFVGQRNQQRMPSYLSIDLGVEHRFRIFKLQPWIGVRAYNALNAFLPADVQANVSSPAFGSLYNSQFRQYRLQVRFER